MALITEDKADKVGEFDKSQEITDQILWHNCHIPLLQALRADVQEEEGKGKLTMEDSLLLYSSCLIVLDINNLCTDLIQEAYNQVSIGHPGQDKTYQMLCPQYYWRGIKAEVERYVQNCYPCQQATIPRDKTPGYLYLLPVPDFP